MKLLLFSILFLGIYSQASIASEAEIKTYLSCPTTVTEAKKVFSQFLSPNLSERCYDSLHQHLANGEEEWVKNVDFLLNSGNASFTEGIPIALTEAIVKNPVLILQLIHDSYNSDVYKNWCVSPFFGGTPNEDINFDNAAIAALKNATVPSHLENLRQQCINSFTYDREHPFTCKLLTPTAVVASIKQDGGEQLLSGDDECDTMVSYQFTHLQPEWLAILPALTNKQVNIELRTSIRDALAIALPKSPETVLKLLSTYFNQQEFYEACHSTLTPPAPRSEMEIDANIRIDPDPYYDSDEEELNVPKAIQALSQLKSNDPSVEKARGICLKGLQQSLQELQKKLREQEPAIWVYHQRTGQLTKNGQKFATGYAGCGGDAFNNPNYQYEKGIDPLNKKYPTICQPGAGPLPTGRYIIGPLGTYRVGKNTLPLTPEKTNVMENRQDFYIRGETRENQQHPGYSSNGCIILQDPAIRRSIGTSVANGEDTLEVVP